MYSVYSIYILTIVPVVFRLKLTDQQLQTKYYKNVKYLKKLFI